MLLRSLNFCVLISFSCNLQGFFLIVWGFRFCLLIVLFIYLSCPATRNQLSSYLRGKLSNFCIFVQRMKLLLVYGIWGGEGVGKSTRWEFLKGGKCRCLIICNRKRADERKGRKKGRNPEMQGTRGGRGLDPLRLPRHGASWELTGFEGNPTPCDPGVTKRNGVLTWMSHANNLFLSYFREWTSQAYSLILQWWCWHQNAVITAIMSAHTDLHVMQWQPG